VTDNKLIEITVPVLNEEKTLAGNIEKILAYINSELAYLHTIHVVIADNGSTDQTQKIAESLQEIHGQVRYIRSNERGVGRALKASWESSQADIVGYMDLDLATDLQHIRPALTQLTEDEADVVNGSRLVKGAKVKGRSLVRGLTSRVFNHLVKIYFRTEFTDGMCGFKFLQRRHIATLREKGAVSDGWFFATELLVVAEHLKLRVNDIAVEWTDDPNSKVKIARLTMEYLKAMKELKFFLARSKL
jgi:glycosyltransferase involved in cell wall biosynthesis